MQGGADESIQLLDDPEADENSSRGPMRTAKTRFRLDERARRIMEDAYAEDSFPTNATKLRLCNEVSGTMQQIQVWFQNRRQRDRLAQQQHPSMPVMFVHGSPPAVSQPSVPEAVGPQLIPGIPRGMYYDYAGSAAPLPGLPSMPPSPYVVAVHPLQQHYYPGFRVPGLAAAGAGARCMRRLPGSSRAPSAVHSVSIRTSPPPRAPSLSQRFTSARALSWCARAANFAEPSSDLTQAIEDEERAKQQREAASAAAASAHDAATRAASLVATAQATHEQMAQDALSAQLAAQAASARAAQLSAAAQRASEQLRVAQDAAMSCSAAAHRGAQAFECAQQQHTAARAHRDAVTAAAAQAQAAAASQIADTSLVLSGMRTGSGSGGAHGGSDHESIGAALSLVLFPEDGKGAVQPPAAQR